MCAAEKWASVTHSKGIHTGVSTERSDPLPFLLTPVGLVRAARQPQ